MIALEILACFMAYACAIMVLLVLVERIVFRQAPDLGGLAWLSVIVAVALTLASNA